MFAGAVLAAVLRLLYATLRAPLVDPDDVLGRRARGERLLIASWHDGVLLMPLLRARPRWPPRLRVLLSWHRDAEIAARALAALGIASARGSTTRGALGAMRGLLAAGARGDDVVIVPDGPRGPRHEAKQGVVQLARATGAAVVPIASRPRRRGGSAAGTACSCPLPFARVAFRGRHAGAGRRRMRTRRTRASCPGRAGATSQRRRAPPWSAGP